MDSIDLVKTPKKHRVAKSGAKAKKKKDNDKKKRGLSSERYNPKAFSVANIGRTKKNAQRNLDKAHQKEVVALRNRAEEIPPPVFIVVMGPANCGKTTLIRSLVKMYTGQNLTDTKGPITVVSSKKKRVTFFECSTDIHSMTDLAKVADVVLIMIDGSYGFEMVTYRAKETLNSQLLR
jgi:ribosome biogenesis protein BMS1